LAKTFQSICEKPEKDKVGELVFETQEISESEKYLRMIVDSSLDGITVVDEQGKFEFVNDSFLRIIEWPREEIIGNYFMKIIPEDMNEFIYKQWDNLQKGIPDDFETKIITKSGKTKYVNVAHRIIEIEKKKKAVSVTKDISEKKKLNQLSKNPRQNIGNFMRMLMMEYTHMILRAISHP